MKARKLYDINYTIIWNINGNLKKEINRRGAAYVSKNQMLIMDAETKKTIGIYFNQFKNPTVEYIKLSAEIGDIARIEIQNIGKKPNKERESESEMQALRYLILPYCQKDELEPEKHELNAQEIFGNA